jgi:hypothetical protein
MSNCGMVIKLIWQPAELHSSIFQLLILYFLFHFPKTNYALTPPGITPKPGHPLARGLVGCYLFNIFIAGFNR